MLLEGHEMKVRHFMTGRFLGVKNLWQVALFCSVIATLLGGQALAQSAALSDPSSVLVLPGEAGMVPSGGDPAAPKKQILGSGTPGKMVIEGGPAPFGIPARFAVSPANGAMTYSVPIELPPGVAGMQPKIALAYDSAVGSGLVGVGWSISGLQQIVRCPQTVATNKMAGGVNDDANDRFCLDGQQLIAVPAQGQSTAGVYGASGTNYAKEIDDLSEIISYGSTNAGFASPSYFVVHTKSGATLEFGNTTTSPNSQLLSASGTVVEAWALDKVTDLQSNYMTVSYSRTPGASDSSQGVLYPTEITYAGNAAVGTSPTNGVVFNWQTRTDAPVLYAAGTPHETQDRLASIETYVGSTLVSDYVLAYQYGVSTQRSELTSITKYDGSSPQAALPPLTFTYSDAQIDTQPDLITSVTNGFGASTNIIYLPASSPTVDSISFNSAPTYPQTVSVPSTSVVRQVQQVVPVDSYTGVTRSDTNVTYSTIYSYGGPEVDLSGRGYLGFYYQNAADQQTGLSYGQLFYQNFPFTGDPGWTIQQTPGGTWVDAYENSYTYTTSAQGTTFPYLFESVETRNDIKPGSSWSQPVATSTPALPTITRTYFYDAAGPNGSTWGNLIQNVVTTSDGYSKTINNTYNAANTTYWLTGLLAQSSVTAQGMGQSASPARVTNYLYYMSSFSQAAGQGIGLLESTEVAPGAGASLDSTTSYTYDQFGNVTSQAVSGADVATATTKAAYNSLGQFPVTITNALNQTETLTHDPRFGSVTNVKDIDNQTTDYSYDTFGRLIKKTNPDGSYTATQYTYCVTSTCTDQKVAVEKQSFASGGVTEAAPTTISNYDAIGRDIFDEMQTFDGSLSTISHIYGRSGNLAQTTKPYIYGGTPIFITNMYDELGRVLTKTYPDGSANVPSYAVDTTSYNGQTITATNSLGQASVMFKDGHGNVTWSQDSLGNKINFVYDGFDQRTKVTDVAGNVTTYNFDIRGHNISGTDPDKGNWTASYNSMGELVSTTDAVGNTAAMTYDLLGRMTQRVETGAAGYTSLTGNWTYDTSPNGVGKLASETASGTASPSRRASVIGYTKTFSYDGLGRLSSTAVTEPYPWAPTSNGTVVQNFTYDSASRPTGLTTNWGDGTTTAYNSNGYPSGVIQTPSGAALWTQTASDAANSITSATFGNAITQSFTRDINERITNIAATTPSYTSPLQSVAYTYDALGNVLTKINNATVIQNSPLTVSSPFTDYYSYDGLNRLCSVNTGASNLAAAVSPTQPCPTQSAALTSAGVSVTYDSLGDVTAKLGNGGVGTYTYPAAGQLRPHAVQSIANNSLNTNGGLTSSFTYDADGNMLSGNGRTIAYTAFGTPGAITQNGNTVTLTYDPDHNRVTQTQTGSGAVDTMYYTDMDLINAANGSYPATVRSYFHNNSGQIVGAIDRMIYANAVTTSPVVKFYLNDWQNSVSAIACTNSSTNICPDSSTGTVLLEAESYDAWGKRRNLNGTPDVNNAIASQAVHGYTNEEHLPDVGLIDLNARVYDPYVATMLSVDPAVANWLDPQTWNAYAYARDNPMRFTDPTGETSTVVDAHSGCSGWGTCDVTGTGINPETYGTSLGGASSPVAADAQTNTSYNFGGADGSSATSSNLLVRVSDPSGIPPMGSLTPMDEEELITLEAENVPAEDARTLAEAMGAAQLGLLEMAANGGSSAGVAADSAFSSYMSAAQTLDVSTAENGSVFYSGAGNRALAEKFAASNGRTTLEMTPGGSWLDAQGLFGPSSPLTPGEATQVWSTLSGRFAAGASGNAVGFVEGARAGGIFNSTEFPALLDNPNITNVITGGH